MYQVAMLALRVDAGSGAAPVPATAAPREYRALFWPSEGLAPGLTLRIERAADGEHYARLATLQAIDPAGLSVLTCEVVASGLYRVFLVDGEAERELPAQVTGLLATPLTPLISRVRSCLGELRDEYWSASEILDAAVLALADRLNPDLGTSYEALSVTDATTGESTPVDLAVPGSGEGLPPVHLRLLALATAISLVSGDSGAAAATALVADSPAGRVNTTTTPGELRAFVELLRAEYAAGLAHAAPIEAVWSDLDAESARGYEEA